MLAEKKILFKDYLRKSHIKENKKKFKIFLNSKIIRLLLTLFVLYSTYLFLDFTTQISKELTDIYNDLEISKLMAEAQEQSIISSISTGIKFFPNDFYVQELKKNKQAMSKQEIYRFKENDIAGVTQGRRTHSHSHKPENGNEFHLYNNDSIPLCQVFKIFMFDEKTNEYYSIRIDLEEIPKDSIIYQLIKSHIEYLDAENIKSLVLKKDFMLIIKSIVFFVVLWICVKIINTKLRQKIRKK